MKHQKELIPMRN